MLTLVMRRILVYRRSWKCLTFSCRKWTVINYQRFRSPFNRSFFLRFLFILISLHLDYISHALNSLLSFIFRLSNYQTKMKTFITINFVLALILAQVRSTHRTKCVIFYVIYDFNLNWWELYVKTHSECVALNGVDLIALDSSVGND